MINSLYITIKPLTWEGLKMSVLENSFTKDLHLKKKKNTVSDILGLAIVTSIYGTTRAVLFIVGICKKITQDSTAPLKDE